jgi:hypothetical protein
MIDYSKITMPQAEAEKYSFTQPPNTIIFYNTRGDQQIEVLRITKEGITANPNVPIDEAASAVIRALDVYIKNLVNRTWVGLTNEDKQELAKHHPYGSWEELCSTVEAKLKDKNGG